jgi:hypothetical protein
MRFLAYLPVAIIAVLAGWSNLIHAATLSDSHGHPLFWQALAVSSAAFTGCGLSVIASQWSNGRPARALAACGLLGICVAYDVLAAYSNERRHQIEIADATQRTDKHRQHLVGQVVSLKADATRLSGMLPPAVYRAEIDALRTQASKADCAAAFGPNKWSRSAADRKRAVCDQIRFAQRKQAQAEVAQRNLAETKRDLERVQAALMRLKPANQDVRVEVLNHEQQAWLTVLLVVVTALLGPFAVEIPRKPSKVAQRVEPSDDSETEATEQTNVVALPGVLAAMPAKWQDVAGRLVAMVEGKARAPEGITVNGQTVEASSQRRLAQALDVSPTRVNRFLNADDLPASFSVDLKDGVRVRLQ